jgi:hypothetical protein
MEMRDSMVDSVESVFSKGMLRKSMCGLCLCIREGTSIEMKSVEKGSI